MKTVWLWLVMLAACLTAGLASAQDNEAPAKVYVGMYVNDIQAIDLRTHSYGMDFYVWFRWQPGLEDPSDGFEFMNMFDPEGHVEEKLYDEPLPQPDGSLYQIIRHQGLFTSKFPVARYPFDSQNVVISIEDATEGSAALQYVADADGLVLNQEVRMPGYDIGTPRLVIRDKPYNTAFGDLAQPDVASYSRAEFIVPVTRPAMAGVLKTFIPVLLVVLAAAFALLLDPAHVEARIGLAITALLTLVAMQFTMQSSLPDVAYLTLLDQVYMLSYFYVLMVIALVVRGTRVDDRGLIQGGAGSAKRLAAGGPVLAASVTSLYLVAVAGVTYWNLTA